MRGRKPKPTTIKLVTGNPGRRPLPPDEPRPPAGIPKCPVHLDAEAKREWRRMARELDELGILTAIDRAVFAAYCQSWSAWKRSLKTVQREGIVIRANERETEYPNGKVVRTTGVPIIHPLQKVVDSEYAKMMKALTEMGMSPSSRSRVSVAGRGPAEADRRERFFK